MFALWIIVVTAIALMATSAYTIFSVQQTADLAAQSSRNTARMETASLLVKGMAGPVVLGGPIRPPMGRNVVPGQTHGEPRHLLPESMIGSDVTPWGAHYGWCPVMRLDATSSELELSSAPVRVDSGPSYEALGVENGDGRSFLLPSSFRTSVLTFEGDAPMIPTNVLGFIVSPPVGRFDVPLCSEIAFRDGAFVIGGADTDGDGIVDGAVTFGGTVTPVSADSAIVRLGVAKEEPTVFVSPVAAGDGDGSSAANSMTFAAAMNWWRTASINDAVFSMMPGDYAVSGQVAFHRSGSADRITIRSHDGGEVRFVSSAMAEIAVSTRAVLEGVAFDQNVGLRVLSGGDVVADRNALSRLRVDGGKIRLSGGTSVDHRVNDGAHAIEMTSGTVALSGDEFSVAERGNGRPAILALGGTLDVGGTNLFVEVAEGVMPWELKGSARIDVGLTRGNVRPTVSWNGSVEPIENEREVALSCSDSHSCTVACPPLLVPRSGTCETGSANASLASFGPTESGWSCRWSQETPAPSAEAELAFVGMPAPTQSTARALCSAVSVQREF